MKTYLIALATLGCVASGVLTFAQEGIDKMPIESLITDLASTDGAKRTAASAEIFRRGKAVLPDLKKAGAKQVAPVGASVDGTRRLDIVYSALEGFPPNVPKALAGYNRDSFGLHVVDGTREEEVQAMCKKYGCTLEGKFNAEFRPSCYLRIGKTASLEAAIRNILANERKVVTINLNYFDR
jgi:hypothetical protein